MAYNRITNGKKPDTTQNGEVLPQVAREPLYPFRIDKNTVIYVPKRKMTEEYKKKYIKRMEENKKW